MKPKMIIRIVLVVAVLLSCMGLGGYSFWRLHMVEQLRTFNLYELVPDNATIIFEADDIANLLKSIGRENKLYVSELFSLLNKQSNGRLNTGMNRFGFEEAPFAALCGEGLPPCMRAEGVYSHFYAPHDAAVTREQFSRFCAFRARAEKAFGPLTAHIAATGGVLAAEGYCLDLVRPGIGLYGYAPQGFARGGLRPAMRVYAQVAANRIYRGGGMGYRALRPRGDALAVVRCGYADGFFRRGRLCMDAAVEESPRKKYERVCVLSDADECARACGTISYEVLVRAAARAERVYVNG